MIENIAPLVNLTKLYLGKNKITKISGLETLVNLTCLSLQVSYIKIEIMCLNYTFKMKTEHWCTFFLNCIINCVLKH